MGRISLVSDLRRVDDISLEVEKFVPEGTRGSTAFRADLAGFLVVAMAVSYENCVKRTLVERAALRHRDFESFAERNFEKLNSRVQVSDLIKYATLFDPAVRDKFKQELKFRKQLILNRTGHNIEERYHQILKWRHAYAHSGEKNTTIKEALEFHTYGKRVLFCFAKAFDS